MEQLAESISHDHGVAGFLAGVLIILCLHLVMKIINMIITVLKNLRESDGKKLEGFAQSMEKNTRAIHELTHSLENLSDRIVENDISASKTDIKLARLIAIVKYLAGEQWGDLQKQVETDEFIERE